MKKNKQIISKVLFIPLFLLLLFMLPYEAKAEETSGVETYTSTVMPEYVDMYYVITVDNNCKKVKVNYYIKDGKCDQVLYNFNGNVITTTVIGTHTTTNHEGVNISFGNIPVINSVATIEFDFSEQAINEYEKNTGKIFTNYSLYFMANNESDTTNPVLGTVGYITVSDGKISFVKDHRHEDKTLDYLNKYCNPDLYDGYGLNDYGNFYESGFLQEIKEKSESITEGCSTNEEKVYAIYKWIAENISYDYPASKIIDGTAVNVSNAAELSQIATNEEKVYRYKRGVCDGYTHLARLMLVSVGVPCINLSGDCRWHMDIEGNTYKRTTHAWNAVYVNNQWALFDFTWGSGGKYYGDNSKENVNPYFDNTKWFASTGTFGKDHVTYNIFGDEIDYEKSLDNSKSYYFDSMKKLIGIEPKSPKKVYVAGSKFEPCKYNYLVSDGTKVGAVTRTAQKAIGYDLNKPGTYTVTINDEFGVFKSSYDIKVVSALNKPVIKKAKVKGNKLNMSWTQIDTAEGYEVQYSLYGSFVKSSNTKCISTGKTVLNIDKLKKKNNYYIRVRAYKLVDGYKIYGNWSNVKKVRIQ